MAHRFCTRCNAEVEDAGGYCLLGHDLRLEAPVDSLRALRAEVNRTFDEARRELADVMAPAVAVAPAPSRRIRLDEARVLEGDSVEEREWADAPVSVAHGDRAPEPSPQQDPAPPPPRPVANVWDGLDDEPALSPGDPIASFAPSPRMDWGPRKAGLLSRRARDEQRAGA
ncbi:MAG TPA: hypothetical protein VIG64_14975 [Actinomycetota bacterium]|jgi:hypothetical protein